MSNKKGSLNLSIQAIVIIVLAMTLLGLGLTFVRSQFQQIGSTGTQVQKQVQEQITSQLRTSGEKVAFPRSIQFDRGERKTLALGVQNTGKDTIFFKLNLSFDPSNSDVPEDVEDPQSYLKDIFDLRWNNNCLKLSPAESQVYGINVRAPQAPGTFSLRVKAVEYEKTSDGAGTSCDEKVGAYATKLSFLNVG